MADKYVKLDDVLKLLNRNSITKAITFSDGISIYDSVQNLPTDDVVPKSEVERLENTYNRAIRKINNKTITAIRNAKQEVAREIFEEIEKVVGYALCVDLTDWSAYTELKKKYTEGDV